MIARNVATRTRLPEKTSKNLNNPGCYEAIGRDRDLQNEVPAG